MKSMLSKAAWLRVIPFVLFMVMLAIRGNWPAGAQAVLDAKWVYGLGVLLVGGALYVLWPQYQELARDQRKLGWLGWLLSITVGVVVFVLWINLTEPWMIIGTPTASFQPVDDEGQLMWSLVLIRWVGAALMVPVMEELFWRSFLMRWIDNPVFEVVDPQRVTLKAVVLSTFVFTLAHTQWLAAALAGLAYAWLYIRTGKLWTAVAAHAVTSGLLGAWVLYIRLRLPPSIEGVGLNNFTLPLTGFFEKWIGLIGEFGRDGWIRPLWITLAAVTALTVQAAFVLTRWQPASIWWRVGAPFALLFVMVGVPVWEGYPGAFTRVVLPLTLAFNVLVPRGRRWLPLLLAGNLSVIAGLAELAPPLRDFYRLAGERRDVAAVTVERGDGWYQIESDGTNSWRWSRQQAVLRLTNRSARPLEVRMSAEIGALSNRHMEFRVNGQATFAAPVPRRSQRHEFPAFLLPPGTTRVEFATDQPAARPVSGDPRELSLSVGNVVIAVAPPGGAGKP